MFTSFFYLLRNQGLKVSPKEWLTLMEGLDKGLHQSSLLGFYRLARAVLVHTEADFDKFDLAFLSYFQDVQPVEEFPKEFLDWLLEPIQQVNFDKAEVDRRFAGMDLEQLRNMLEERLREQTERHDGGSHWVGTGGTSPFGHSGYAPMGIRVGGESRRRSALQVAGERNFRDFRADSALEQRQFQVAFRRLRQLSSAEDGPRDELDLDGTIRETCDNAGRLELVYGRPRRNTVKVLLLFDSGGSMWPYANLCATLFRSAYKSNRFKDLKVYYFHNIFYDSLYTQAGCADRDAVDTNWVLQNLKSEYRVIAVGDGAMAPSELLQPGGSQDWWKYNEESGLTWLRRFIGRYEKMIWLNPIPAQYWDTAYGHATIGYIRREVPMFPLSVQGLEQGLKHLMAAR